MGRREAALTPDTRLWIVRLAIMIAGLVVLTVGALSIVLMIGVLIANGRENFAEVGHTDTPAGPAIVTIACICGVVATLGWRIFLNGRYGPRKKLRRGGKHAPVKDDTGWSG